jgi:hypothetical protein
LTKREATVAVSTERKPIPEDHHHDGVNVRHAFQSIRPVSENARIAVGQVSRLLLRENGSPAQRFVD